MKSKSKPMAVVGPTTNEEKLYVLSCLARLPVLFAQARGLLKPEHFPAEDAGHSAVWSGMLAVATQNGGSLPSACRSRLSIETEKAAQADFRLSAEAVHELVRSGGVVDYLFDGYPDEEVAESYGSALLAKFLEERSIMAPLRSTAADLGESVPADVGGFLRGLSDQHGRISTLGFDPVSDAFPQIAAEGGIGIRPTGVKFLDGMMGGGHAPGETYTLMGPTGVGKSTLGIQLAVSGARHERLHCPDPSSPSLGHWYYFIYEYGPNPEVYFRIWSHAARILRPTLWDEFKSDLSNFSRTGSLKEYERERFRAEISLGNNPPGEFERLQAVREELRHNLHVVDMSGTDPRNPKAGSGWVNEVAAVLARERDKGRRIAGFVIDDADTLTSRHMEERNVDTAETTAYLGRLVMDFNRLCAGPFACPGWITHQLTGKVNDRSPTKAMHHTAGSFCKSFPKNAWFAFQLGTKDPVTSTCLVSCSKSRRANAQGKEVVVHIDGAMCTMTSGDGLFTVDHRSKRIMLKSEAERVAVPPPQGRPKLAFGPGAAS